jgi:hypothetical protein
MFRPHVIQVTDEIRGISIAQQAGKRNPSEQKDKILLPVAKTWAPCFDQGGCGGKITTTRETGSPRYCRLRSAPKSDEVAKAMNRDPDHSGQSATV